MRVFGVVTITGAEGRFLLPFDELAPRMLNPWMCKTLSHKCYCLTKNVNRTCGRQAEWWLLKIDVHVVIPRVSENVTVSDKRELADVIKDPAMRKNILDYPAGLKCNHRWLFKRKEGGHDYRREDHMMIPHDDERHWSDVVTSQVMLAPRCCRRQRMNSCPESPEGNISAPTLILQDSFISEFWLPEP